MMIYMLKGKGKLIKINWEIIKFNIFIIVIKEVFLFLFVLFNKLEKGLDIL